VKVSDGFLYPLKNSLIFIQKPIIHMKHKDIIYVEFQRVGQQVKNFDISIVRKDVSPELFKSIDK